MPAIIMLAGFFIGSFLGVVIDRSPLKKSVFKGRSCCTYCEKKLGIFDLIPIVSFILLGGKCRYCHKKISIYYPIFEITTGVIYFITAFYLINKFVYLDLITILFYLFIASILIVVFFSDLKYEIIPNRIVLIGILIALLYILIYSPILFLNHVYSGFGAFLFLLFIFLITRGKGMGFGDVKFALFMGILLPFPSIIVSFYIAFLTGAAVSIILILWKGKHFLKKTIPFGPFLALATYISFLWGDLIWQKALNLLL